MSHQYYIRTSPDRVFAAISKPVWIKRWLADVAEIEPRKGGRYTLGWTDGPRHSGTLLEYVPGRRITLSWAWDGVELRGTRFRLSVQPKGNGSLLKVEHSGFPRHEKWSDLYGGTEWGWTYFAMNLKSLLETGRGLRSVYDG
ncbi:MAG: SRPBCC family protein [Thermoplasmata archaeon]